ncbi:ubiquitin-like-specific protease 1D [Cocos nucifera]|uniref:Ubiquitin-like-specific protease 1D n=1 Tax=Cocos nucifera TaxID=13894 RepID=A0A8K0N1Q7_COCNU|nr:ubiquitin-like-specific protease 1D [Cocos nucifera]
MANERLHLRRRDSLPGKDDAPTTDVEASAAGGGGDDGGSGGESEALMVAELSDHQLQEKIQRLVGHLSSGMPVRLRDKGVKLRAHLRQLQDELDRRKLAPRRKDVGEHDTAAQSRITKSSGKTKDSNESLEISESHPQPSFALQVLQKLQSKADAASNKDLRGITLNKCKSSSEGECQMHERRQPTEISSQPTRMSTRESPFPSSTTIANKDEQRSSKCDLKAFESFSTSLTPLGENYSSPSTRKRRISEARDSLELKSEKVQEVVVLDEEMQPVQPIQIDDSDKWKEATIYYPSRDDPESVEIAYADLKCLEPESYLSSPIMNFYMHWHWSLVIICIPAKEDESGPIILHLDSLGIHSSYSVFDVIERVLEHLVLISCDKLTRLKILEIDLDRRVEKKSHQVFLDQRDCGKVMVWLIDTFIHKLILVVHYSLTVPQQNNEYDCGLFVLYFMERFIEEAPERLRKKDLAMFGRKWFQPEDASGLRKRIRDLLLELFENAELENGRIEPTHPLASALQSKDD